MPSLVVKIPRQNEVKWQKSLLLLAPRALSPAEFLLAPFPALLPQLFPCTGASLHGERAGDRPPVYERSALAAIGYVMRRRCRTLDEGQALRRVRAISVVWISPRISNPRTRVRILYRPLKKRWQSRELRFSLENMSTLRTATRFPDRFSLPLKATISASPLFLVALTQHLLAQRAQGWRV